MNYLVKYFVCFQLFIGNLFFGYVQASSQPVYLVLSDDSALYHEVTGLIQKSLPEGFEMHAITVRAFDSNYIPPNSLLVPVGRRAAEEVSHLEDRFPVIYSFIEAQTLNRLLDDNESQVWQASVINQPLARLISAAKPLIRNGYQQKLLVIIAINNQWATSQIDALSPEDRELIEVMVIEHGDVAARLIEDSFYKVAAVVAINDTAIWAGNSAKWILHQAYTYQVPVVGYAQTFQKAGAMISVYSSLDNIAETTAGLMLDWQKQGSLSGQGFVYSEAHTEVNEFIARALNFQPDMIKRKRD